MKNNLRKILKEKGVSSVELADMIWPTMKTYHGKVNKVHYYCEGKTQITPKEADKIIKALNLSGYDELLNVNYGKE